MLQSFQMQNISSTFTKLIVDSDADGIVCAALLLRVFPGLKIVFSSPSQVQDRKTEFNADPHTIVADLPFINGCGLYFDHHESNDPHRPFNGIWRAEFSAARVIFENYKTQQGLEIYDFEQILPILDKFDSGNLTSDDLNRMDFFLRLIYSTKKFDEKYFLHLIDLLASKGPSTLVDDELVRLKINEFESQIIKMKEDIKNVSTIDSPIAFVNLINKSYSNIHVTFLEKELYDNLIFVVFKKDAESIRVNLYDNNLNPKAKNLDGSRYDLLSVAKIMNPEHSGGHTSGCGFSLPKEMSIDECIKTLTPLLKKML